MKKYLSLVLTLLLMTTAFVGCSTKNKPENVKQVSKVEESNKENAKEETKEAVEMKVAAPSGAPTLSMVKMFKDDKQLGDNITVNYESVKSPELMASKMMSGEVDLAVVPTNLAVKLYNKGVEYQLASSNVWGILYIVSSEELNGWEALKGKEIYMIGRGLTPDVTFRHLLKKNGLDPEKDVTLTYMGGATELAPAFISGKSTVTLMPEPMLSTVLAKKPDTKITLDLQKEWMEATGAEESYPQASLVVKKEFAEKNPEAVKAFIEKYEEANKWANENPAEAGVYAEELKTGLKAKIVEKAMPRTNIRFVSAEDAREHIETYIKVLMEQSPESVGGKLPDDGFYYKK